MAKKFVLATDSTSCIRHIAPYEKDIDILPLYLSVNGRLKRDYFDIGVKEFVSWMRDNPKELPYSKPPTPEDVDEMIEKWIAKGYEEALFVSLASAISDTHRLVREGALRYKNKIKIAVFDSRSQSFSQVLLLLEGKRLLEKGYGVQAVATKLEFIRRQGKMFFTVDSLKYLVGNGRLTLKQGTAAKMLRMHPILTFNEQGNIVPETQKYGLKAALHDCVERCVKFVDGGSADIFVTHIGDKNGLYLERVLKKYFPNNTINSVFVSPVIACHTGPELYGVGAFLRK